MEKLRLKNGALQINYSRAEEREFEEKRLTKEVGLQTSELVARLAAVSSELPGEGQRLFDLIQELRAVRGMGPSVLPPQEAPKPAKKKRTTSVAAGAKEKQNAKK